MERKTKLFNPVILSGFTLIVAVGTVLGALGVKADEASRLLNENVLFAPDFLSALKNALLIKFIYIALIALGGLNITFLPLPFILSFIKSYAYGFTAGCFVGAERIKGLSLALTGLFIHNFLFTSVMVFYSSYAVNKSVECFLNRRNYEYRVRKNKSFTLVTIVFIFLALLIALIESSLSALLYDIYSVTS